MTRKQLAECTEPDCARKPLARDLCRRHYQQAMGIRSASSTPNANAETRLRSGGWLTPPISLPYRALARSCPKCGDLMTTPAHLLRKDAGKVPRCHGCQIRAVLAVRKKRAAVDAEFKRALRKRGDRNRARTNSRTAETATNLGKQWTGPELEIAARSDLTAQEVALMLGRTLYAVKHARRKLKEPKWAEVAGLSREVAP